MDALFPMDAIFPAQHSIPQLGQIPLVLQERRACEPALPKGDKKLRIKRKR
ncbi:MAG: hypothetical protein M1169_01820 [Firmicutes bacterium]|nr:hypothetical protein [Bacillota bacterium]